MPVGGDNINNDPANWIDLSEVPIIETRNANGQDYDIRTENGRTLLLCQLLTIYYTALLSTKVISQKK